MERLKECIRRGFEEAWGMYRIQMSELQICLTYLSRSSYSELCLFMQSGGINEHSTSLTNVIVS